MKSLKQFYFTIIIFIILVSAGCGSSQAVNETTAGPTIEVPAQAVTTVTPTSSPSCYFNWATQSLPELTVQVQSAIDKAGLTGISARAEAYGENCYDAKTQQVVYFTAMETDFRFQVQVETLADKSNLGDLLERILSVLDDFPPAITNTPQTGYIGIAFRSGTDTLNLWFKVDDAKTARSRGFHGAELLEALLHK